MSVLQEQAIQMIRGLSDENTSFLIELIQRFMQPKIYSTLETHAKEILWWDKKPESLISMQAFYRLDAARTDIKHYLPKDFNPDKELEEARFERYGDIDWYKVLVINYSILLVNEILPTKILQVLLFQQSRI